MAGSSNQTSRTASGSKGSSSGGPSGRGGRGGQTKRPRWQRVLLWLVGLGLLAVLALAGVFAVAYASTDIPDPNEFAESQSSIIYYADGETEMARFTGGTNRESVPLDEVPDHVQKAMLSAEDRTFYENEGVSITGTARAAWRNLTSDSTQGGSTITQQYVKNYYLTNEQSYRRKFQELMISVKIDNELSKDEILERYLNTIYYGRGAYGTQTAAQAYFGKDVGDLDVSEGAFLAAVTNAPSLLDPAYAEGNQERAEERFAYIIDGMVSQGWLSEAEGDAASFPELDEPQEPEAVQGPTGYIVEEVRKELVDDLEITDDDIDRGGLRITSTIIQKHQEAAEVAVAQETPTTPDAEDLKVGLVAVTPGDGAITAMYGGADYQEEQLNITTQAPRQAGSLFKVFTLVAALEGDVSTLNTYPGFSPQEFDVPGEEPVEINNFRDAQFGDIDLRTATANSVNTVFVALNEQIGPENTSRVAREMGLPEDTEGLDDNNLTNVLGTAAPTMVPMANAFAAIAADGELAEPYIVAEVSSTNEVYDYVADPETTEAVDPDITADVTDAMTRVITEGSGTGAGDLGRPAAGKSGTSSNNVSAWFNGFTPQVAAAVTMYKGDGTEPMQDIAGVDQITGGSFPVAIWGEFMRLAQDGDEVIEFPERVGVNDGVVPSTTPTPVPTPVEPTTEEPSPTTEAETETETVTETETTEPTETTQEQEPSETTEPEPTQTQPDEPTESESSASTTDGQNAGTDNGSDNGSDNSRGGNDRGGDDGAGDGGTDDGAGDNRSNNGGGNNGGGDTDPVDGG
ncbi:MAG: transglycosylase domain-containing protein [Ornithinimicrobium sp.]